MVTLIRTTIQQQPLDTLIPLFKRFLRYSKWYNGNKNHVYISTLSRDEERALSALSAIDRHLKDDNILEFLDEVSSLSLTTTRIILNDLEKIAPEILKKANKLKVFLELQK